MKMIVAAIRVLALGGCALACGPGAFAQGTVIFNNHIAGTLVTHVYAPDPCQWGDFLVGNGPDDYPAGTTDWTGHTPLSGFGFFAQLWAANGAYQPESALQAATPTTSFRTGTAAGWVAGTTATLSGVPPDAAVATIALRVWDCQGGTIVTWDQALNLGVSHGESPLFNVSRIGGIFNPAPILTGLQSFNLPLGCGQPYFAGWITQPTSQTVPLGGTATFEVEACACPVAFYQWFHDGVPVQHPNDQLLRICQITNAQPSDAGNYWADEIVYQFGGSPITNTSAIVSLTVLAPPIVTSQPVSQTAEAGSRVRFSVLAQGLAPLGYTWFFNDNTILTPPTTDGALLLTNVQLVQAGEYTVLVTNSLGSLTSAPALLSVIPPVPRKPVPALRLTAQPGSSLNLDFTDALSSSPTWLLLENVNVSSTPQWYVDPSPSSSPQRFYRAWQNSVPGGVPGLDIALVPAIILTGRVGDRVRVDAINQFGPIDAWFTLATVTLTNTSQLFFDAAAPGQPQRLYRLVQVGIGRLGSAGGNTSGRRAAQRAA